MGNRYQMQDNLKLALTFLVSIPSLMTAFYQYQDKQLERAAKEAKADTLQLLIQKQNEQNKKLADFFAALDSAEKLHAVADTTGK